MRNVVAQVLVCWAVVGISGCVYVSGAINPFAQQRQGLQETVVSGDGRDKIVLLNVSEVITNVEHDRAFGLGTEESTVARVQEVLRMAREDRRVRSLVLRLNSPGGGVTASDIIYREVRRFKEETGRPVVAALMDVATSGAYYVALAADEIVASPTTVTGSIGVILMGLNVEGLLEKIGVRDQTVKSGPYKDLLSPLRRSSAEERIIVQGVVDALYERFVSLVQTRRPEISTANLDRVTDGRIFTASQAQELGLVDRIGYLEDAIADARAAAGVSKARVVMYHRGGEYRENVYSGTGGFPRGGGGMEGPTNSVGLTLRLPRQMGPSFMYLWVPRLDLAP